MTISTRTPEGIPSRCPLCGESTNLEYSDPAGDATCPRCGCLVWAAAQLVQSIARVYEETLGISPGSLTAETRLADLGADSLDTVEMVMELEEEFDLTIPDDDAQRIQTIADAVRYLQANRRSQQ